MSPEPPSATSGAAPTQAAAVPAPAMPGDAASFDAPDTVPDQLRDLPPEAPDEEPPAESPAGSLTNAPELSPAACGARLAELFPALFTAPGAPGPAKPIKLRIHADIQARAPGVFTKRMLGIFFSRYTTSNAYLKALSIAPHRFDLDGQPAGEIAAEHRQAATDELARRHALAAERRAAQRTAPRRDATAAEC
jgi:ProP effector